MISVEGLKVEFGVKPLFSNASFVINARDRVALVGKNGAGKSTLLKILCGQQRPTEGVVNVKNDCRVGYLPQVMILQDQTTVREEAQKAFADVSAMKERVDRLEREMNERTDYDSEDYMELVERYSTAHERFLMMKWISSKISGKTTTRAASGSVKRRRSKIFPTNCTRLLFLTYCCWTSLRTIWILRAYNGWSSCWLPGLELW